MIAVRLPDGRTLNTNAANAQDAQAGARRFLAYEAANKTRPKQTAVDTLADAATFGLDRPAAAAMYAGATGIKNLAMRAMGKTPDYTAGDAFQAARQLENDRARQYSTAHPVASTVLGLVGGLAAPGSQAAGGFIGAGKSLPGVMLRSGILGGVLGGVNGAATANPGHELQNTGKGALLGGVTGAAIPAVAAGVGAVVDNVGKPLVNTIVRATNKATGGALLDANSTAAARLAEALKADGLDAQQIKDGLNSFLKNGVTPSLVDIASQNGGGQATRALLRGAAMKAGPARNIAVRNNDQVASDLQDNAIGLARRLTPDTRPAVTVADELKTNQAASAATDYRQAYQTPVQLDDGVHLALSGQPGQQAIALARKAAVANQDALQVHELGALSASLQTGAKPPPVSAGTLDRIRINLGNLGQGFNESANMRNMAPGYFNRAKQIDSFLEQVPELGPARAAYRDFQGQRNAVELGQTGLNAHPDELAAELAKLQDMSPTGANPAAGIGYRDAIVKQIGAPAEGSTGVLNKLSTATNQGKNLSQVFGPDAAQGFQEGTGQLVDQLNTARFLNPNTGSQTAGRAVDADLVEPMAMPKPSLTGLVFGAIDKVRRGATLTDAEREALLKLGTARPNAAAIDALPLAPPAQTPSIAGRLSPAIASYAGRQ